MTKRSSIWYCYSMGFGVWTSATVELDSRTIKGGRNPKTKITQKKVGTPQRSRAFLNQNPSPLP